MKATELERMAAKLYRDARAWRKNNPQCGYVDGVYRGLHEAAKSCLRRARRVKRIAP